VRDLTFSQARVKHVDLFAIKCDLVNSELARRVENLASRLLQRMSADAMSANKQLCVGCQDIADHALRVPTDTDELVVLREYMERAETEVLPRMELSMAEAQRRLEFLMEHSVLSSADMATNTETFTWMPRMGPILEQHRMLIRSSREKAEAELQQRRVDFAAELGSYYDRVAALAQLGNHADIEAYRDMAVDLRDKLAASVDVQAQINKEEDAFAWDNTEYPMISKAMGLLEPYAAMYVTICDFQQQHHDWLEGDFREVNPEVVEDVIDKTTRLLYKSEKLFQDEAAPKALAARVKVVVADFKENLPLVQALCNSGLRERHWQRIEELVGIDLTPTAESTLQKVLDLKLESHLEALENVSDAATKEHSLEREFESPSPPPSSPRMHIHARTCTLARALV